MPAAIVIGGGLAGLSTAVSLVDHGFKVKLLERRPILGGRAYSFRDPKTGCVIDNGQHLLMGCYRETFAFLKKIGSHHLLRRQASLSVPLVTEVGTPWTFGIPDLPFPQDLLSLFGILRASALPLKDRFNLLKLGFSLKRFKTEPLPETLKSISARDWLLEQGQSAIGQKRFWDILIYATLNDSPERAHAYGLATVLVKGLLGSLEESTLYFPPEEGLSALYVDPAMSYLAQKGAVLSLREEVEAIFIREKGATGDGAPVRVKTKTGELTADVLISAVSSTAYPRLFDKMNPFGEPLLAPQESSPILSVNLFVDRPVLPEKTRFLGSARGEIHWWFEKRIRPDLVHLIGVASGARHLLEASKDEIVALASAELRFLFPHFAGANLIHALVNKEREATFSLTPQDESRRSSQESASPHFYRVGDWTKTDLPATLESAAVSATLAVQKIENDMARRIIPLP